MLKIKIKNNEMISLISEMEEKNLKKHEGVHYYIINDSLVI